MNSKYYKSIVVLRKIAMMQRRFVLPFKLVRSRFYKQPSYFPEMNRKSKISIFMELLFHIFPLWCNSVAYLSGLQIVVKDIQQDNNFSIECLEK